MKALCVGEMLIDFLPGSEKDSYIRCERSYGQYARQFDMSAVDTQGIKAKYDNGVLTLTLPKKQQALPESKRLEIE